MSIHDLPVTAPKHKSAIHRLVRDNILTRSKEHHSIDTNT